MVGNFKPQKAFHILFIFSGVIILFCFSVNVSSDVDYQRGVPPEAKTTTVLLSKIRQSGQSNWGKLREILSHGHSYFFPPNIDFRGKDDVAMGTCEKVREAAAKSFEESKETVEETARSAAEVASDAAGSLKDKVKKSVSGRETQQQPDGTEEL